MYTAVQITNTNTNWWHLWQCAVWAEPAGASNWNLKKTFLQCFSVNMCLPPHGFNISIVMFQNLFIYVQLFIWRDLHALHMYFRIRGNPMQAALSNSLRFTPTLKAPTDQSEVHPIFSVGTNGQVWNTLPLIFWHGKGKAEVAKISLI